MSLIIPLLPGLGEEIAMSFATGALVTGIALIATGFAEGMRGSIAYFQEAIIVQMAGMGAGPAALAWLNDKPDFVFFGLTIVYAIIALGYLFYTVREQDGSNPLVNCFLDQVSSMYGKSALKIANGTITGIALVLIVIAIIARHFINVWKRRASESDRRRYRYLIRIYKWVFVIIIFAAETVLAVVIQFTLHEFNSLVSPSDQGVLAAWDFGQIIPLMMLLGPLMDVIRAVADKIYVQRAAKRKDGQATVASEKLEEGQESSDAGIAKPVELTETIPDE